MSGKHLGMGINIHTSSLCLLQQHFQISQVVTGNQNTGIFSNANVYLCDLGISIGFRVGLVQQSHTGYTMFSGFHCQGDQVLHVEIIIQCSSQRLLKESVHLTVILQQHICVLGVCRQSLQTVGDQFSQRTDIFIFCGKYADCLGLFFPVAGAIPFCCFWQDRRICDLRQQYLFFCQCGADSRFNALFVKICIGDSSE